MLGGARIVRLVVLQESRITASATAPPAPHNKLSRLPWIHRVSLEGHTNGEYAQKNQNADYAFFRAFSRGGIGILPMPTIHKALAARYCVGDSPENLLKTRLNCESD